MAVSSSCGPLHSCFPASPVIMSEASDHQQKRGVTRAQTATTHRLRRQGKRPGPETQTPPPTHTHTHTPRSALAERTSHRSGRGRQCTAQYAPSVAHSKRRTGQRQSLQARHVIHVLKPLAVTCRRYAVLTVGERVNGTCSCLPASLFAAHFPGIARFQLCQHAACIGCTAFLHS